MKYADVRLQYLNELDHLCTISPAVERIFREVGVDGPRTTVTPNILDAGFVEWDRDTNIFKSNELHFIFTGRLIPGKGLHLLLEAAEQLPEGIRIHIIGSGPLYEETERGATHLDNVECHGYVNHTELPAYYHSADAFIHPAEFPEPFGRAVLEALAAGLPTIVSDIGAPPWIAGDACITFQAGEVDSLVECIEQLAEDPVLRETLRDAATIERERFEPDEIIPSYVEVYESVL